MDFYFKPIGKINSRQPNDEGKNEEPILRENLLSRFGKLKKVRGTEKVSTTEYSDRILWAARYYSQESGVTSPKSFAYTKDGVIHVVDEVSGAPSVVKTGLNQNTHPKHTFIKTQTTTKMYWCDGIKLYKFDGNNDNTFASVSTPFAPIDLEEHLDRLWAIDKTNLYCSKNLDFEVFDDATDSLDIIVGSGKGENLALQRLGNYLFIFTTEGIFALTGDTISAVAESFSVEQVSDKKCLAGGSVCKVEESIMFIGEDYELYSFNGSSVQMVSFKENLRRYINEYQDKLSNVASVYFDNYYMVSFTEKGKTENNLELWYDSLEDKCEIIRGRNVSCYLKTDATSEAEYLQIGRSDANYLMWTSRGHDFDSKGIQVKLTTRDITPKKGENVRFTAIYLEIEPFGTGTMFIRYLLDGRVSNTTASGADLEYPLAGEVLSLGLISIKNQTQVVNRVQPKIAYAKGHSIRLEISNDTVGLDFTIIGIGIDFHAFGKKKGKIIGE